MMSVLADALAAHVGPDSRHFVDLVFSLHDSEEIERLFQDAGHREVTVTSRLKPLELPPPADFLWQYVRSTPLGGVVGKLDEDARAALEEEVVERWQPFTAGGTLVLEVPAVEVTARR